MCSWLWLWISKVWIPNFILVHIFWCSHFEGPTETDQVRTGKSKIALMNKIIQAYVQVHLVKLVWVLTVVSVGFGAVEMWLGWFLLQLSQLSKDTCVSIKGHPEQKFKQTTQMHYARLFSNCPFPFSFIYIYFLFPQ